MAIRWTVKCLEIITVYVGVTVYVKAFDRTCVYQCNGQNNKYIVCTTYIYACHKQIETNCHISPITKYLRSIKILLSLLTSNNILLTVAHILIHNRQTHFWIDRPSRSSMPIFLLAIYCDRPTLDGVPSNTETIFGMTASNFDMTGNINTHLLKICQLFIETVLNPQVWQISSRNAILCV